MKNYNINIIEKNKLIINGKGDNQLWNEAESLTDFVSAWDKEAFKMVEFKGLWDSEKVFFNFRVFDNEVHINKKDNSFESIRNSDRVEIFFRTDELLNPYYCLEIDPTPRIMDFKAYPNKQFDFDWNWTAADIEVKSSIDTSQFTVEIAITIVSLKKLRLLKDGKMEVGIFRAKYNQQKNGIFEPIWITWVNPNTETPNFHTPSSFGELKLMRKGDSSRII